MLTKNTAVGTFSQNTWEADIIEKSIYIFFVAPKYTYALVPIFINLLSSFMFIVLILFVLLKNRKNT